MKISCSIFIFAGLLFASNGWAQNKKPPKPPADRQVFFGEQHLHTSASPDAFAFGTRLTHLTPALRHGDVDTAVDKISQLVVDWSGGTRIGESLKSFNYQWSRRVLGWEPKVDFDRGLALTAEWYKSHPEWWERIKSGAYRDYYEKMYASRGKA